MHMQHRQQPFTYLPVVTINTAHESEGTTTNHEQFQDVTETPATDQSPTELPPSQSSKSNEELTLQSPGTNEQPEEQQDERPTELASQPPATNEEPTPQSKDSGEQAEEPTPPPDTSEQPTELTPQPMGEQADEPTPPPDTSEQPTELTPQPVSEQADEPTPPPDISEQPTELTPQPVSEQADEPTPPPDTSEQPTELTPQPMGEQADEPTPPPDTSEQPTELTLQSVGEQAEKPTVDQADEPPSPSACIDGESCKEDNQKPATGQYLHHNICPPQSSGEEFTSNTSEKLSNSVLIVNGLSSLGARVAFALAKSTQWEVLSIASSHNRLCGDKLIWYRKDQLREKGICSIFVDWSQSSEIGVLFKARRPSHVIVVPPNVGGGGSEYTLNGANWGAALHDFVTLVETVRTVSPNTRMTLVSVSKSVRNELEVVAAGGKDISLLETLVGAFELTLSTYHTLYQIPFSVVRLRNLHGPWTHDGLNSDSANPEGCFIDDVVAIIHSALSLNSKCVVLDFGSCDHESNQDALEVLGLAHLTSPAKARAVTESWKSEYLARRRSRLVLTSYFTGHGFHTAPDRFQKLQDWLKSVTRHRLEAVVLHNGLGDEFMARCNKYYSNLQFESVYLPFDYKRNSSCRQSVIALADYLERRPDVESVVVMDLDRSMKRNVFPLMEAMGDWLYSDLDMMPFYEILAETPDAESGEEGSVVLTNSLVVGGSRHMVLAMLNKMADCLRSSQSTAALNCLMDENFVRHSVMGWPLSVSV